MPARQHVVLHIGSGKTGTSSIQALMHNNRGRLEDLGVLYPRTPGNQRHVKLGLFIRSDAELESQLSWRRQNHSSAASFREQFERDFLEELQGSGLPRVLLSDEALYGASRTSLTRLRELTDRIAESVRVVVYLRRQDDHLLSRYQQVVKVGETRRLAERTRELDLSAVYDYAARLRTWQELVDPETLVVRRFERESWPGGSLYQDFFEATGINGDAASWDHVDTRNESLDAETVEFLRIVNVYLVEQEHATPGVIDHRRLVRRLRAGSSGPALTLPDDLLAEFMDRWAESNTAIAREYLDDPDGDLFRPPGRSHVATTAQYLDPDRLEHFLRLADLPDRMHEPLRGLVEREARTA